jgi:hypothetical protein
MKLLRIEMVFLNHAARMFLRWDLGDRRIEIGGRNQYPKG